MVILFFCDAGGSSGRHGLASGVDGGGRLHQFAARRRRNSCPLSVDVSVDFTSDKSGAARRWRDGRRSPAGSRRRKTHRFRRQNVILLAVIGGEGGASGGNGGGSGSCRSARGRRRQGSHRLAAVIVVIDDSPVGVGVGVVVVFFDNPGLFRSVEATVRGRARVKRRNVCFSCCCWCCFTQAMRAYVFAAAVVFYQILSRWGCSIVSKFLNSLSSATTPASTH